MQITKRIRLDFARALSPIYVFAKQGDVDSRYVEVEPLENGKAYTIPAGVTAAFACQKPDGHQVLIDGATSESGYPKIDFENNLIILELTDQTLAAAGDAIATAVLKNASTNQVLSTQNFILKIERSALEGASVESADEYQGYIAALNLIDEALKKSEDTVKEEEKRAESELERQLNEETRQEAEKERVEIFAGWKEQIDGITADNAENRQNIAEMMPQITSNTKGITQNSQLISRNSARLTNLEQRISPSPFVTDSTVAYVKDVPANVLPYAELQKLGGMTRKSTNLLPNTYTTQTISGVTFTVNSDGSITANGTATATIYFKLAVFNVTIGNTYYLSGCPSGGSWSKYLLYADASKPDTGSGALFTATSTEHSVTLFIESGVTVSNITFYPMVNAGATALPYEPYFKGLRSAPVTSVESVGANLAKLTNEGTWGVDVSFGNDGKITLTTATANTSQYAKVSNISLKANTSYTFSISNATNIKMVNIWKAGTTTPVVSGFSAYQGYTPTENIDVTVAIYLPDNSSIGTVGSCYLMVNKGANTFLYAPYTKSTLPIPEAVQVLDGYGEGVNESVYNYITWNPEGNVKTYTKAVGVADLGSLYWVYWENGTFYTDGVPKKNGLLNMLTSKYTTASGLTNGKINGNELNKNLYITDTNYTDVASFKAALSGVMLYYELATPEVTDISALITADNLLPVQGNGTITFVNEYGYAVPSTVEYMT